MHLVNVLCVGSLLAAVPLLAQRTYPEAVLSDEPVAYWRMGEPAGSPEAADVSGHGKPAKVKGAVYFGQLGALERGHNTAVDLSGNGYFSTALAQREVSRYSLEAWVKTTAIVAPILQDRGYHDNGDRTHLSITLSIGQPEIMDGKVHCGIDGDETYVRAFTKSSVNDGHWHHIVCVFAGEPAVPITPNQFSIYVDGQPQLLTYSANANLTAPVSGSGTTIGIHPIWEEQFGMPRFVGSLDEVAIYPFALDAAQVLVHYKAAHCLFICD